MLARAPGTDAGRAVTGAAADGTALGAGERGRGLQEGDFAGLARHARCISGAAEEALDVGGAT